MQPHRRQLFFFLGLEVFAIPWAILMFASLPPKPAGALAGGYFVLSGIYMLNRARKWPLKWRSPTWSMLLIHVFAVSLPMLGTRFVHWQEDFAEIRILGVPGPVFHNISSIVFTALIAATVADLLLDAKRFGRNGLGTLKGVVGASSIGQKS